MVIKKLIVMCIFKRRRNMQLYYDFFLNLMLKRYKENKNVGLASSTAILFKKWDTKSIGSLTQNFIYTILHYSLLYYAQYRIKKIFL